MDTPRSGVRRRWTATTAIMAAAAMVASFSGTSASASAGFGTPQTDPAGVLNLPSGYTYTVLATAGSTPVTSTESGATFTMPEDADANVVVRDRTGQRWLVTAHELTRPRPGETFTGDVGKAAVPEQATTDDGDVDGWGSVTRIPLSKNGLRAAGPAQVITTGLHNLCAGALTPWGTFLVNEEFPFPGDTQPYRSGFVWEIDPITGSQTKLTGMGRFSHEQEALVGRSWYLTDDLGTDRFIYKFVPRNRTDLTTGALYGLAFDKSTGTGRWVGPLDPMDPHAAMVARGYDPVKSGFSKAEGIVKVPFRNALVMSDAGSPTSSNPGRVWMLDRLTRWGVSGHAIAEGSFSTLSHPDNLRYAPNGDLYIMEDNGSATSTLANGGMNEIRVLPSGMEGTANTKVFATVPNLAEPTGPWFSWDGRRMYLSLQGEPSRSLVIQGDFGLRHHGDNGDDDEDDD